MDITTITSAYSAVKSIKDLGSALLDAKIDADSKQKISEVLTKLGGIQDTLFYIREELLRVQEENHQLKSEIKQLNIKHQEQNNIQYEKPSYWVIDKESKDGPFCQRCYDADKKLVRLQGGNNDAWTCRECKISYQGPNYKAAQPRRVKRNNMWDKY